MIGDAARVALAGSAGAGFRLKVSVAPEADRVMVDRSDAEWNGQVIAEARQAPSVPDVTAALRAREVDVFDVALTTGAVAVTEGGWVRLGVVPGDDVVRRLVEEWPSVGPARRPGGDLRGRGRPAATVR